MIAGSGGVGPGREHSAVEQRPFLRLGEAVQRARLAILVARRPSTAEIFAAAQASTVSVELTLTGDTFVATIADDGIGARSPNLAPAFAVSLTAFTPLAVASR